MYQSKHTSQWKAHGGIALIIGNCIIYYEVAKFKENIFKNIILEEKLGDCIISAIYCPPKHKKGD